MVKNINLIWITRDENGNIHKECAFNIPSKYVPNKYAALTLFEESMSKDIDRFGVFTMYGVFNDNPSVWCAVFNSAVFKISSVEKIAGIMYHHLDKSKFTLKQGELKSIILQSLD